MSGGITRLKQHLTHTKGYVAGCSKVTTNITKRVLTSMHEKEKITKEKKRNIEILRSANTIDLSEDEDADGEVQVDSILKIDHGKTKQSTLDKNNPIKQNLKMVAWKKIATWAYTIGLPFNAVRALEDMNKFVDSFRAQWQKYGCSIMSDFWIDGKGRCLIKFLVNFPTGMIFLKSIDASEHVKDAQLIVKMINEVIEDVGEDTYYSKEKEQISKNLKGGPNERLISRVWSMIQTRWTDQLHHPLHAAGCFLNPTIFHGENSKVDTNNEILTDLYVAIDRLVPDP
ncbi:zinc finger, CCHC-type containing protein, partial [Tanacetum coccineum]